MSNKRIRKKKAKRVIARWAPSGRAFAYLASFKTWGPAEERFKQDWLDGMMDPKVLRARAVLAKMGHNESKRWFARMFPMPKPTIPKDFDVSAVWMRPMKYTSADWAFGGDILI